MSHMSLLEANARYSIAISILNKVRHWLLGREGAFIEDDDKKTFLESLDINQNPVLSDKMILYSLQGFGNYEQSAAIELSEAIAGALKTVDLARKEEYIESLKKVLESSDANSLDAVEKSCAMELVTTAMHVINAQTSRKSKSLLSPQGL